MTLDETKAAVLRRIASACASNDLHRCTTARARPNGRKWDSLSDEELTRALTELRAEGRIRSVNGYWYVRGEIPKFGGARWGAR